jgi:hypothetical protein
MLKESTLGLHAQAIANMVVSIARKTTIMENQNIMTLFKFSILNLFQRR